jgi:hypothetical protein
VKRKQSKVDKVQLPVKGHKRKCASIATNLDASTAVQMKVKKVQLPVKGHKRKHAAIATNLDSSTAEEVATASSARSVTECITVAIGRTSLFNNEEVFHSQKHPSSHAHSRTATEGIIVEDSITSTTNTDTVM